MLSPRWRKVARDVSLHKARTALVVLAIVIGIVGAGAVLDKWALLRRATAGEFGASNPASATLRTDSIDAALLARVRALPSVRDAEARRTITASARTKDGWRTAMIFSSTDFDKRIGVLKSEQGTWPPRDGAIVVEASSAEFAGVTLGASLGIQIGNNPQRELEVSGIARDVGLPPGWMEHVVYAFATPATIAALGGDASLNELQIVARDPTLGREEVRRVAAEVRSVVETSGRRVWDIDVPVPGRHAHAGQINSMLYTQGAFGVLALFMSALLVVNLVAAMLTGQVREIGIMKAIGARAPQIARMYLVLALGLGLVATAIAVPAAAILGRLYARFTADMLNFDVAAFSIPAWAIAVQVGVGVLLPVAAAALPVLRGSRISVGDALRDFGVLGRGDNATPAWLQGLGGVTRPTLVALRNAFRRRQRMILTLLALAMGGGVYIGALNLRTAVSGSVDLLFGAQRFDMVLRFTNTHRADSIDAIVSRVSGVGAAETWMFGRAGVARADGSIWTTVPLTGAPLSSERLAPMIRDGRGLRPGDGNAMVVNRRLLDDDSTLTIGSSATLIIAGRRTTWTIVGVAETGPSPAAYVPREALAAAMGVQGGNAVVVKAEHSSPATQLDLIHRLRSALSDAGLDVTTSQLMASQRRVVEDHLLLVVSFLGVKGQILIVVGGLGLASTMSLAVLERTREIGVLRAIGARHRSILTMIQVEGLVIAVLSWGIAIPISIPMSVALGKAFSRIMLEVPVILLPDLSGVLRWLVVVVLVSLVACAWPAYRALKVSTRAALAYE